MANLPGPEEAITADGSYDAVLHGRFNEVIATGDFGGGTLSLYVLNNDTSKTAAPISGGEWTSAFSIIYEGGVYSTVRFVLSGATDPSINISLVNIR